MTSINNKQHYQPYQVDKLAWWELTVKQRSLLRHYLEGGWTSYEELADNAGVSTTMVYDFLSRQDVKQLITEKQMEIDAESFDVSLRLRDMTRDALDFLQDVVKDAEVDIKVRVQVAQDILDRTIGKVARVKVNDGQLGSGQFTSDEIRAIGHDAKKILQESIPAANVVDAVIVGATGSEKVDKVDNVDNVDNVDQYRDDEYSVNASTVTSTPDVTSTSSAAPPSRSSVSGSDSVSKSEVKPLGSNAKPFIQLVSAKNN